jgi:hypothetical protein
VVSATTVLTGRRKEPPLFFQPVSSTTVGTSPRSAFASYASPDRQRVFERLSSVRVATGIEIFVDCLDLRAGEKWKEALVREILSREAFLLFWCHHYRDSPWCMWELHSALKATGTKGKPALQIHPMQPASVVPPPAELAHLHFSDRFALSMGPHD